MLPLYVFLYLFHNPPSLLISPRDQCLRSSRTSRALRIVDRPLPPQLSRQIPPSEPPTMTAPAPPSICPHALPELPRLIWTATTII